MMIFTNQACPELIRKIGEFERFKSFNKAITYLETKELNKLPDNEVRSA
ncbi:MAG: hypothetical protein ACJAW3_001017 [Lentimonas sp.]|jgi:hypothetical protein